MLNYQKSYDNAIKTLGKEFADSDVQFVDAYVNAGIDVKKSIEEQKDPYDQGSFRTSSVQSLTAAWTSQSRRLQCCPFIG